MSDDPAATEHEGGIGGDELLTPEDVAELFSCSTSTVYRYAREGDLPSIKVGGFVRFPRSMLWEFIRENARRPEPAAERPPLPDGPPRSYARRRRGAIQVLQPIDPEADD